MYFIVVAAFMVVCPLLSIAVETMGAHAAFSGLMVGKWFVFWGVGIRLLTAGLRQILQPGYTVKTVLGMGDIGQGQLFVRELGFANTAMGIGGTVSLIDPRWLLPVAAVGGVFYALAGINHALHRERGLHQHVTMASNLFIAVILLGFVGLAYAG